jgi:hypothetical protein
LAEDKPGIVLAQTTVGRQESYFDSPNGASPAQVPKIKIEKTCAACKTSDFYRF